MEKMYNIEWLKTIKKKTELKYIAVLIQYYTASWIG